MFKIVQDEYVDLRAIQIINQETGDELIVSTDAGATVLDLKLSYKGKLYNIFAGFQSIEEVQSFKGFKGAILFPFPNRIKGGKYTFKGETYSFPVNEPQRGNAIHGLVYDRAFVIHDQYVKDDRAVLELQYGYEENHAESYPFPYTLRVKYELTATEGLICTATVVNRSDDEMPFGFGWHPYFKFEGVKVDDLKLHIPAPHTLKVDEQMIPIGEVGFNTGFRYLNEINDTQFDTAYRIEAKSNKKMGTEIYNPKDDVKLTVWQEAGPQAFNYVQVYTPEGRDVIAIEPMTCPANAFNTNEGLIILQKGQQWQSSFGVKLTDLKWSINV